MMFTREEIVTLQDIKAHKKIVLWGAGNYIEELLTLFDIEKITAIYDSDKNKWGRSVCGIKVSSPIENFEKDVDDETVIMISAASYNYQIANEIISRWKISDKKIYAFTHLFGERYMYDVESIFANEVQIQHACSLLADSRSKEYFMNTLTERINRNPVYLRENPCITDSYEYTCEDGSVITPQKGGVILDCGAYIGDTAELFLKKTGNDCRIYAVEPLAGNYERMCRWVKSEGLEDRVYPIHALLGDHEGESLIRSSADTSVGSSMENDGNISNVVPVRTLDGLTTDKVSFIKMDIEGAEINALKGAVELIRRDKPQMIISAYHRTKHVWEIPLLLKEIEPAYKIFCGHQRNAAFEPEFYVTV